MKAIPGCEGIRVSGETKGGGTKAHLRLNDLCEIVPLHQQSQHARHHPQWRLSDNTHKRSNDSIQERLRLGLDDRSALLALETASRELVDVVCGVEEGRVDDCVERVESRDDEGEEGEGLLGGEVTKGAREDALPLED